jgi:hypothetical protein
VAKQAILEWVELPSGETPAAEEQPTAKTEEPAEAKAEAAKA